MAQMFRGTEPAANRVSPWQPQPAVLVSDIFLTSRHFFEFARPEERPF